MIKNTTDNAPMDMDAVDTVAEGAAKTTTRRGPFAVFRKPPKIKYPGIRKALDGGAAVVVASRAYAQEHSLTPLARVVGYAQAAVEPKYLFAAPAYAIPKLLKKIGWTLTDVDLIELNEAFAAQVLAEG